MTKLISGIMTLGLALVGFVLLSFSTIAPANASIPLPEKITYCQAEGNGTHHPITVSVRSLVDSKGNLKQGGINKDDIVGPFAWDFGGDDHGKFLGQNWTNQSLAFIERGCVPLTADIPVPVINLDPATCANLSGTLQVVSADARLTQSAVTVEGKTSSITFTKPVGDTYIKYTWADGTLKDSITLSVTAVDPVTDPLWDTTKGLCRMPDTGAGISTGALLVGAGLIFAGLLVFSVTNLMRRK